MQGCIFKQQLQRVQSLQLCEAEVIDIASQKFHFHSCQKRRDAMLHLHAAAPNPAPDVPAILLGSSYRFANQCAQNSYSFSKQCAHI
eukprot:1159376-Pelagomonas_calceolata.AAC.1